MAKGNFITFLVRNQLIEKKEIGKMTAREKLELQINLVGYSVCRIFEQQNIVINRMVKDLNQPK